MIEYMIGDFVIDWCMNDVVGMVLRCMFLNVVEYWVVLLLKVVFENNDKFKYMKFYCVCINRFKGILFL